MKFGVILDCSAHRSSDLGAWRYALDQAVEQAIAADAVGFDYCWTVENHVPGSAVHLPAPDMLLASIAAKTTKIRLGYLAQAQPAHAAQSLRLAERAALLDHMSHGRMELAVSEPGFWAELARALEDEEVVSPTALWQETLGFLSESWCGAGTGGGPGVPRPLQMPAPPVWGVAKDKAAAEAAGRMGLALMVPATADDAARAEMCASYHGQWPEGAATSAFGFSRGEISLCQVMVCAADDEQGARLGLEVFGARHQILAQQTSVAEIAGGEFQVPVESHDNLVAGDPNTIVDRLRALEAEGLDGVNLVLNAGGVLSQADVLASLRLFATEVMPVFQRTGARVAAE